LRAQPLLAQRQAPACACGEHALGVRVAAAARVAFRGDQHMLAESGQMLSTERTSIRRRLAIRRTAHRPPWGGRKLGHGSIVAPLAATVAASIAIGVGVSRARAERARRDERERDACDRRFELLAHEPQGRGLRRMALGQLDIAIEQISSRGVGSSPERSVHEARKALKRLRALMRLLEDELGERAYARESTVLREAGERLARARDAEVLLATLDGLLERHPKSLGGRRGVQRLRAKLQRERDGAAALALAESDAGARSLQELQALRARVAEWELAEPGGIEAIEPALRRLYGKGRRRMRRAERARGERARGRKMHEWRKRVKDLRYAAEMLNRAEAPEGERKRQRAKGGRKARRLAQAQRRAAFIGKLAKRADDLGELLGEEHDLAVLAERVRREAKAGRASGAPGAGSRRALLRAIARRRKRLRKRALRNGQRLYARKPKAFVRRVRAAAALAALSRR
jgi:CHAD domain-containing protein